MRLTDQGLIYLGGDGADSSEGGTGAGTRVQVVVRVRPVLPQENASDVSVFCTPDGSKVQVNCDAHRPHKRVWMSRHAGGLRARARQPSRRAAAPEGVAQHLRNTSLRPMPRRVAGPAAQQAGELAAHNQRRRRHPPGRPPVCV